MTIEQIVSFANHKYGESAYWFRLGNEIQVWTAKSKWRILLSDMARFGHYTLYHLNHKTDKVYYHRQCESKDVSYLVYYAVLHDLDKPYDWKGFQDSYELYVYGQELAESCARFAFLSGDDWHFNTDS